MKSGLIFVAGAALGVAVASLGRGGGSVEAPPETPPAVPLSCESTAEPLRDRVRELEKQVQAGRDSALAARQDPAMAAEPGGVQEVPAEATADEARLEEATKWRVSAIEKFVPLTEDQKRRLSEKFVEEGRSSDGEADTESLEDILGEESASYYRQQVKSAFQRVQDEETEKEVVWVSRQLSLSPAQERGVRDVYVRVEQQVRREQQQGAQHGETPKSPQDRVKQMVRESRLRNELRSSMLKDVLTPEQYEAYMRSESESAASEMEVFHDPGSE